MTRITNNTIEKFRQSFSNSLTITQLLEVVTSVVVIIIDGRQNKVLNVRVRVLLDISSIKCALCTTVWLALAGFVSRASVLYVSAAEPRTP